MLIRYPEPLNLILLSVTLMGSCLATPEPAVDTADQTSTAAQDVEMASRPMTQLEFLMQHETDPALRAAYVARAVARAEFAVRGAQGVAINVPDEPGDDSYTEGGHCNVRLSHCDPYPIGKGNHRKPDAQCSQVCLDTIAHCEDYSTAEIEFCCAHPDEDYRVGGKYIGHCMPSGEPNWDKRCAPGLNP